ncbi:hypothetical protein PHYC_00412 [Phycisphaerales bacterium]|nr:hypothetical protein PHYC_00412 [Phycisphaerales bacterium]
MHTPVVAGVLRVGPVGLSTWLTPVALALGVLAADEIYKHIARRHRA